MCFDVPRCSFMFFVYRNSCFLDCFLSESLGPQDKPMACQTSWQQFAPGDCKARFVWLLRIVEKLILVECSINVEKWEGSNMFCLSQKWLETWFLNKLYAFVCICMLYTWWKLCKHQSTGNPRSVFGLKLSDYRENVLNAFKPFLSFLL